jgi:putative Holliday junction resolvase
VAVSDPHGTLASPLPVVERPGTRKGWRACSASCASSERRGWWSACRSASPGPTPTRRARRAWAAQLGERLGGRVPVVALRRALQPRGWPSGSAARAHEDSRAAAHLLEGWLASQAR